VRSSYRSGQRGAFIATGGAATESTKAAAPSAARGAGSGAPAWARRLRTEQRLREAGMVTAHAIRDGDRPASGENPKLRDED
jgi:type IV secretion system protein TrbL